MHGNPSSHQLILGDGGDKNKQTNKTVFHLYFFSNSMNSWHFVFSHQLHWIYQYNSILIFQAYNRSLKNKTKWQSFYYFWYWGCQEMKHSSCYSVPFFLHTFKKVVTFFFQNSPQIILSERVMTSGTILLKNTSTSLEIYPKYPGIYCIYYSHFGGWLLCSHWLTWVSVKVWKHPKSPHV